MSHWIEHPEGPRVGEEEEASAAVLEDVLAGALDLDAGQEEVAAADHSSEDAVRLRRAQGRRVEVSRGEEAVAVGGHEVAEQEWVVVDVAEAAEEGRGGCDADPVLGGEDGAADGGSGRQAEQDVCHYIVGKGVNGGGQWRRCRGGDLAPLLVLHHLELEARDGKRIGNQGRRRRGRGRPKFVVLSGDDGGCADEGEGGGSECYRVSRSSPSRRM